MMATGRPIRYGYVEFRSKHLKSWRKRWLVFERETNEHPARLVKYSDEREVKRKPEGRHRYNISDVISAERMPGKDKAIRVHFKNPDCKEICFICDSEASANDWVSDIQRQVGGATRDTFPVKIVNAHHVNLTGEVILVVREGYLMLIQNDIIHYRIPLTTIRKYQMDKDNVFWIESGRSSPIGEGFLHFQSCFAYCVLSKLDEMARITDQVRRGSGASNSDRPIFMPNPDQRMAPQGPLYVPAVSSPPPPHPAPTAEVYPPLPARPIPSNQGQPIPDFRQSPRSHFLSDSQVPDLPFSPLYTTRGQGQPTLVPYSQSLSRLPTQDLGSQGARGRAWAHEAEFHHTKISRSGSGMVAPTQHAEPAGPSEGVPYMDMANTAGVMKTSIPQTVTEEERLPYMHMQTAEEGEDSDYLTPKHERESSDKRNS